MRSRWVGVRPRWSKKGERDAGVKRAERRDPKGKGEKGSESSYVGSTVSLECKSYYLDDKGRGEVSNFKRHLMLITLTMLRGGCFLSTKIPNQTLKYNQRTEEETSPNLQQFKCDIQIMSFT
ncbi:hypothetical protein CFP56_004966 [Quercus suber]|uniref:Uncharacterized protein n=1 Tax=Quercus suber TaxID=58331 RepID=A0AAW0LBT0_QUESU